MTKRPHLIAHNKLDYARGKRPNVDCILCAVRDEHPDVEQLEVFRDDLFLISLNLYPYNPGHLMIVPLRHLCWPYELSEQEALRLHHLQGRALKLLAGLYPTIGFNIGYNLGPGGGGSIAHLHLHVVPRFQNEQGFMSTVGQTQILVETLTEVQQKLAAAFQADTVDAQTRDA